MDLLLLLMLEVLLLAFFSDNCRHREVDCHYAVQPKEYAMQFNEIVLCHEMIWHCIALKSFFLLCGGMKK